MFRHPLFSSLQAAEREAVEAQIRTLAVKHDQILVNAGQGCADVFLVLSGKVRVETPSDDGTASLTGFLQPGELYLETVLAPMYQTSNTLRAALDTTVQAVPVPMVQAIFRKYPQVGLLVLQASLNQVMKLRRQLRRLKVEPVRTQVARAMYESAEALPNGHRVLDRKITQSDIAEVTGLSREQVNKSVKQLSESQLVRRSGVGFEMGANLASTDVMPWDDTPVLPKRA
jgi:CRP/FNR family transcriptional regulator, cyclic AMP receptor protein